MRWRVGHGIIKQGSKFMPAYAVGKKEIQIRAKNKVFFYGVIFLKQIKRI